MIIDLSKKPVIPGAKHFEAELNQLYHPSGSMGVEKYQLVYSRIKVHNRFLPILIKESFALPMEGGYIIFDYKATTEGDLQKLEELMWWLWKKKYEIIFHGKAVLFDARTITGGKKIPTKGLIRLICKKTISINLPGDSIYKWTFGIITNGKRNDWVEKIIESIRIQKIPQYEIIICGTYFDREESDTKYIPFTQRDDLGWITKKKNLVIENSKYENICIVHDRVIFNEGWFGGMKKWGNSFEHLGCVQEKDKHRVADWVLHEKVRGQEFGFASLLDYREWHLDVFQSGTLHVLKKSYALSHPWNEAFLWSYERPEDLELTTRLTNDGLLLRLNPFSSMDVLASRFEELPSIPFNHDRLSHKRLGNFWLILARKLFRLNNSVNPKAGKLFLSLYSKIRK